MLTQTRVIKVETFCFQCRDIVVEIEFNNNKFRCARFPFSGPYSREQWKILSEIDLKIEEIEATKKEK